MTTSIQPRKQRKMLYNAPQHKKQKWIAAHLSENLLLKYDKRAVPLVAGDTVKVMRGTYKGHENKVTHVHPQKQSIIIEGVTVNKADGSKVAKPIHSSNVLITKLNLTDNWRKETLERDLSDSTKKEIDREAKQQLKEAESLSKAPSETEEGEEL